MKKSKVFRVKLVYDKVEKKLASVGLREVPIPAIPICDPDVEFPTKIINSAQHEIRIADIIVYEAEPSKHPREITLLKKPKGGK
jgi:hypothetical protein